MMEKETDIDNTKKYKHCKKCVDYTKKLRQGDLSNEQVEKIKKDCTENNLSCPICNNIFYLTDDILDVSTLTELEAFETIGEVYEKHMIIHPPHVAKKLSQFAILRDELKKSIVNLELLLEQSKQARENDLLEYNSIISRIRAAEEEEKKRYNKDFIIQVLELIDSLSFVQDECVNGEKKDIKVISSALSITMSRIIFALSQNGVFPIEVQVGDVFDADIHDAITIQPSSKIAKGCILSVVKTGFRMYNDILRPAAVIVAEEEN